MGRGTRQGDTIAGDVFMDVYHVPLQAYKTATQDDELLLEYGNDVIDAAMTTYADDIAELMVADSAEELDDKAVTRTALLEAELGGVGCQLEPSKEEVVMRWMGPGAHANRKTAMIPNKVTPGKKLRVARYLGGGCTTTATRTPRLTSASRPCEWGSGPMLAFGAVNKYHYVLSACSSRPWCRVRGFLD